MNTLIWIRGKDLRLHDHPILATAKPSDLAVFVLDPYFFAPERAEKLPHRMQYLLEALTELQQSFRARGGRLQLVRGKSTTIIPALAKAAKVDRVAAMRWSEPFGRERDERIAQALNVPFDLYGGETLLRPGTLRTGAGTPYSVFSPFARSFAKHFSASPPAATPSRLPQGTLPAGFKNAPIPTMGQLGLWRNPMLVAGGETAARKRLMRFISRSGEGYGENRNRMDLPGTSRLSADLKFGTLSAKSVWWEVSRSDLPSHDKRKFTNELVWREFNYSTLWDNPQLLTEPFKPAWKHFPWKNDPAHWEAWASGTTGYPIVDAAARQLLATGFVHNRARMIAASFLTKHLQIDYRLGEAHYMRWLTDGDWAQNNMGWQWAAGSGADAQPWFRIFNPMTQGRKFDPDGHYIRTWVPELASVSTKHIHAPWEAKPVELDWCGIRLGLDYPAPIVDHNEARTAFLRAAQYLKAPKPTAIETESRLGA